MASITTENQFFLLRKIKGYQTLEQGEQGGGWLTIPGII